MVIFLGGADVRWGKCPVSGRGGDEAIESKMAKKMRTRSGGAVTARETPKKSPPRRRVYMSAPL